MKNTRREFLKKVAYTAPSVIALGTLVKPTDSSATFDPCISALSTSHSTWRERKQVRLQALRERIAARRQARRERIKNYFNH